MRHRLPRPGPLLVGALLGVPTIGAAGIPADRVPTPRPEPCIPFNADPAEGEMAAPAGLGYDAVRSALNGVIKYALYCGQPAGMSQVDMTFELMVGCNGVVSSVTVADDGRAPAGYVSCVKAVIAKADFPPHDWADGFPVTYPVHVAW